MRLKDEMKLSDELLLDDMFEDGHSKDILEIKVNKLTNKLIYLDNKLESKVTNLENELRALKQSIQNAEKISKINAQSNQICQKGYKDAQRDIKKLNTFNEDKILKEIKKLNKKSDCAFFNYVLSAMFLISTLVILAISIYDTIEYEETTYKSVPNEMPTQYNNHDRIDYMIFPLENSKRFMPNEEESLDDKNKSEPIIKDITTSKVSNVDKKDLSNLLIKKEGFRGDEAKSKETLTNKVKRLELELKASKLSTGILKSKIQTKEISESGK